MFIPSKIKYFLQLCYHNRLLCDSTLKSMRLPVNQSCKYCHYHCESIINILWECPNNTQLWNNFLTKLAKPLPKNANPQDMENWDNFGRLSTTTPLITSSTQTLTLPSIYGTFGGAEMKRYSAIPLANLLSRRPTQRPLNLPISLISRASSKSPNVDYH